MPISVVQLRSRVRAVRAVRAVRRSPLLAGWAAALAFVGFAAIGGLGAAGTSGCGRAVEPENRPIDRCTAACAKRASRQCSEDECRRGCEFIVDRILEKEGDNVLACVSRSPRRCTDVVWADCAARIGVHADGGPPAPGPLVDEE